MPDSTALHEGSVKTARSVRHLWESPRAAGYLALALAALAVAVAIAAWFRTGGPSVDENQSAQAKTNVCSGYTAVRQGIVANTHMAVPNPRDRSSQLAVAANARLALVGGGAYLHDLLAAEPATPADVANALTSMSSTIQRLGVNYLAGANDSIQNPLRKDLDGQIKQVNDLCK